MKPQPPSIWSSDLGILGVLAAMVVVGVSSLLVGADAPAAESASAAWATSEAAPAFVTIVPAVVEVVGIREQATAQDTPSRSRDAS